MKKLFFTAVIALMVVISANAQIKVGACLNVGMPMGDFADGSGLGVGLTAYGKYMVTDKVAVGAQIGAIRFGEKDNNGVKTTIMPITGLVNYYFLTNKFMPYVGADLGIYSVKSEVSILNTTYSDTNSKIGLAPVIGMEYGISGNMYFDGNLKYNTIFAEGGSLSFLGINLGLVFKF